jgi:GNAT superfamily N-acetyltransferase
MLENGMPLHEREIIESIDQYASMWKVLAGDRAGADLSDLPGISVCWADSPFPFWNALFLTEQLTDDVVLRSRLRTAAAYMRGKSHDGLVYVCEDYLRGAAKAALPAILAEMKLEFALPVTGMAGDILPVAAAAHPDLRFERASNHNILQDYADINSEGYGFALEAGRAGLEGSRLWKEVAFAYVGYVGDQPVSASAAIVNDGVLYLALVATRPAAQHNGFAEATVRHALSQAYEATGLRRTILHATDAGFPVYQRVGYHRTTKFLTYKPA